jgi:uncharacterized membrane protein YoaK (UPF0700 family)
MSHSNTTDIQEGQASPQQGRIETERRRSTSTIEEKRKELKNAATFFLFNPISHPDFKDRKNEFLLIMLFGMCMIFCAGFINGCTMSGFQGKSKTSMSVAGMTGAFSNAALNSLSGKGAAAWKLVGSILSYMAGGFIGGFMLSGRKPWELAPEYGPCYLIGTCAFVAASLLARHDPDSPSYFFIITGCNSLQNTMTSVYSSNLIRTSHLSGATTDIGVILGQLLRGNTINLWRMYVLLLLMLSFVVGSLLSYPAAKAWGTNAIIVNTVIFGSTGIAASVFVTLKFKVSFTDFFLGAKYRWETVMQHVDLAADGEIERLLGCMELNAKGEIEPSGLGKGLTNAGIEYDPRYLSLLFEEADINKNGVISRLELKTLLCSVCEQQKDVQPKKSSHEKIQSPEVELSATKAKQSEGGQFAVVVAKL